MGGLLTDLQLPFTRANSVTGHAWAPDELATTLSNIGEGLGKVNMHTDGVSNRPVDTLVGDTGNPRLSIVAQSFFDARKRLRVPGWDSLSFEAAVGSFGPDIGFPFDLAIDRSREGRAPFRVPASEINDPLDSSFALMLNPFSYD